MKCSARFAPVVIALALLAAPALGDDKSASKPADATIQLSNQLTGKLVDLHQYMTQTVVQPLPGVEDRPDAIDRRGAAKDLDGATALDRSIQKSMERRIFALETATGLVILNCEQHPGIYATPRVDQDKPEIRDRSDFNSNKTEKLPDLNKPESRDDNDEPALRRGKTVGDQASDLLNQQVRVDGKLYTRKGVQYFVVTSVNKQGTTTAPDATPKFDQ